MHAPHHSLKFLKGIFLQKCKMGDLEVKFREVTCNINEIQTGFPGKKANDARLHWLHEYFEFFRNFTCLGKNSKTPISELYDQVLSDRQLKSTMGSQRMVRCVHSLPSFCSHVTFSPIWFVLPKRRHNSDVVGVAYPASVSVSRSCLSLYRSRSSLYRYCELLNRTYWINSIFDVDSLIRLHGNANAINTYMYTYEVYLLAILFSIRICTSF